MTLDIDRLHRVLSENNNDRRLGNTTAQLSLIVGELQICKEDLNVLVPRIESMRYIGSLLKELLDSMKEPYVHEAIDMYYFPDLDCRLLLFSKMISSSISRNYFCEITE